MGYLYHGMDGTVKLKNRNRMYSVGVSQTCRILMQCVVGQKYTQGRVNRNALYTLDIQEPLLQWIQDGQYFLPCSKA